MQVQHRHECSKVLNVLTASTLMSVCMSDLRMCANERLTRERAGASDLLSGLKMTDSIVSIDFLSLFTLGSSTVEKQDALWEATERAQHHNRSSRMDVQAGPRGVIYLLRLSRRTDSSEIKSNMLFCPERSRPGEPAALQRRAFQRRSVGTRARESCLFLS